jgi:hypothetical protein
MFLPNGGIARLSWAILHVHMLQTCPIPPLKTAFLGDTP